MIPSVVAGTLARSVEDFLRATFPVSTPAMTGLLDGLFARGGMFKGPYLSIDVPHRLAEDGGEPFPEVPLGYQPYLHQHAAFERLGGPAPQSTIVATGTGSGKTECFLLPILEHCRHRRALGESGIKAILIYPMNALATDQAKRVARRVHDTPSLRGKITAALYVGDSEHEPHAVMSRDSVVTNRDAIRDSPPDILLTNYKMLDYLLIRPRDRRLWRNNGPETLRFVVVDELHSFDGAQGTDLACLLRRLKARLGTSAGYLACVGTSAALGTAENREELRAYAGRIFGENFNAGAVIGEQRQSVGEFLEDVFTSTLDVPAPTEELCAASHDGLESYLRAQHRLWFGAEIPADFADPDWRCALAEQWLKPLPFFQNLLKVLGGRPRGIDAILAELARRTTLPAFPPEHPTYHADLVESVAALVSAARSPTLPGSEEKTRPFLNVRDQLWIRELRRMVSSVGTAPVLRFSDDLSDRERASYLPIVHCLDCASTGWASLLAAGESTLRSDLREFYIAFFGRDPRVTFLFPTEAVGEPRIGFEKGHTRLLCGNCLTLGADPDAGRCGSCGHRDALTRVFVPDNKRSVDRRNGTTRRRP
jgi:DEAD/DEAH box helicase domain-containing protein